MKWKIERPDGVITYHSPEDVMLVMKNCVLKNQKSTALKIFNGANKTVCSWIACESIEILTNGVSPKIRESKRLYYNPRVSPNWVFEGSDSDNREFQTLVSVGNKVYAE